MKLHITTNRVLDANGQDRTDNYVVTTVEGTLTVTRASQPLTVTAASDSKVYDGTPLTNAGYTFDPAQLLAGNTLEATVEGTITNDGSTPNVVTGYRILAPDGTDVTDNYIVTTVDGILSIVSAQVSLTITAGDAEKAYDSTPLTTAEYTYDASLLLPGHSLIAEVGGRQIAVGTSPSTITGWRVVNGAGVDVSGNYTVTTADGTLTVLGRVTYHSNYPAQEGLENSLYEDPTLYALGDAFTLETAQTLAWGAEDLVFIGWTTDPGGASPLVGTTMGEESLELYAQWTRLYTLTVHHVDESTGAVLHTDDVTHLAQGAHYRYVPVTIDGYRADFATRSLDTTQRMAVAGEGQMPAEDIAVTIYYARDVQPSPSPSPSPPAPVVPTPTLPPTGPTALPIGETPAPTETPAPDAPTATPTATPTAAPTAAQPGPMAEVQQGAYQLPFGHYRPRTVGETLE